MNSTKAVLLISLLSTILLYGCKKELTLYSPEISEKIIQKDSVKKSINLDSLDKANASQMTTDNEYWNKISINDQDSILWLHSEMRLDHRIFGYKKPSTKSERLVLFSVFTNDVENNPFHCKYGSYYSTPMQDEKELKFISKDKNFIKTIFLDQKKIIDTLYFETKWVRFNVSKN